MLYGYGGNNLWIDLNTQSYKTSPTDEFMAEKYLGGRGFTAYLEYTHTKPGIKPLSEENHLYIASGPLSGSLVTGAGKVEIGAKSPLTGGYGDSNMGGHIASEMKFAGYDLITLKGNSEKPTVILIDNDKVTFQDASHLWGKGALESEALLKKQFGEDYQFMVIGPAGENLIRFACINHDFGRQAGRAGMGTLMGYKKVKAIGIKGSKGFPLKDPVRVLELGKKMYTDTRNKPGYQYWTDYGTPGVVRWVNENAAFPTKNFSTSFMEGYENLVGEVMREKIVVTDKGCFGCPTPCGKYSHVVLGEKDVYVEGPEYETIALLGGNLLLKDIKEVAYLNYVLDNLGLDTISGGNVLAFAVEALEKGVIKESDIGRKVSWGDVEGLAHLSEMIARKQGIGELLAMGVKEASRVLGGGSQDYAMEIKGMEISGYESRYAPAMMLSYMTADVGGHHNRSWAVTYDVQKGRDKLEGKAKRVIELQHIRPLFDALGVCRLQWVEIGLTLEHYSPLFEAITGKEYSWDHLLRISERIWNLTRAYWFRELPGFGRGWDWPPKRWYAEPIPDGPARGQFISEDKLNYLLDDYYALRGWNKEGLPSVDKLKELELDFVVEDLKKRGFYQD